MHLLELATVFLLSAVVLVPLFQRLKLGGVLGYLAAGMLLGPWGLNIVPDAENTLSFAEFGVALLLFLVGLELEPARLWSMRRLVFGFGGAQVGATGLVLGGVALWLGLTWQAALVAGFGLAMSSTALVLTSLGERGQLGANHGREIFAVLLFQDIVVIPLLALLPLLAYASVKDAVSWTVAAKAIAAIAAFVIAGRVLVRPVLKFIARHSSAEVFTAAALLLVVGSAVIMERLGVTMSLGAFLAGLLLADSEFRHELEADIEPFKGLLLGLFFMTVGMEANLTLARDAPLKLVALAVGFMAIKCAVVYGIALAARFPRDERQRVAVALSQGGEFAFVLFAGAATFGILETGTHQLLVMVVTISMVLATPVMSLHEWALAKWTAHNVAADYDRIDAATAPVIIAGFGRFGQIVSRVLRMADIPFVALDANYAQVDFVRRFGNRIYYGDASRLELLQAAKAGDAKLFVLAIDDVEASVKTASVVRRHFPQLDVLARARNRVHYFRLRDLGVKNIWRETFPASLEVAHQALLKLGFSVAAAQRAVTLFKEHDLEQLEAQYAVHHDEAQLVQTTQQAVAQLRELFEADVARRPRGFPDPLHSNEPENTEAATPE
ncbi:MAG: potassium transporter [Betaproteobacteria bacterium]|jgi:monovalent cation:proton antiporter-2 (CPA2) family protein|nr:potassium transporter [Betaproteobacteria bacterium]